MTAYQREKYLLLKDIDKETLDVLKNGRAFIAGGAITSIFSSKSISDYDVYFKDETGRKGITDHFDKQFEKAGETDTAITYTRAKQMFQLIKIPEMVGHPRSAISEFDYTVCMGAYDIEADEFMLGADFLQHIAQRRLVFNIKARYPLSSLFRIRKFMHKGYTVSGAEIIKLGLCIHKLDLSDYKLLREQLMGIDTLFLRALTDKMADIPAGESKYDFDHFMQMIDEHLTQVYNKAQQEEGDEL